jgi:hypothetical protein
MTTHARALCALITSALLLSPATSSAQDSEPGFLESDEARIVSTVVALTTTGLTVYLLQGVTDRFLDSIFDEATAYLRDNPTAVRQASAVGAGEAVTDLGALFALSPDELPAFGARLRDERALVGAILDAPELTPDHARLLAQRTLTPTQLGRLAPSRAEQRR